ncbi:TPA: replication protein [Enterococcus faecium]
MNTGYVKLHRKVMNSFVWTNPYMYKLWNLCLMKASHENRKILFNGKEIQVNSGEFVTGRDAITSEMNEGVKREHQVNSGSVWRWLKQFEKNGMLNIKSTTKYSVISIKNWSLYQSSEQQMNIKRTTSEQQVHTNKNEKNYKNEKNNKTSSSQPCKKRVYDTDSVYYILAEELFKQICQNQEIKKPNLQSWADDIRKMIEIDKRTENQVRGMIEWSQHNVFWASNILSAKKLREKYDTMAAQANRDYKTKQTKTLEYEKFSTDELPI